MVRRALEIELGYLVVSSRSLGGDLNVYENATRRILPLQDELPQALDGESVYSVKLILEKKPSKTD